MNRDAIVNMDETSIYLDSPQTYTYSQTGVNRVPAITSGNERTRVSDYFAASASRKKLKLLVLIPRKLPLKNFTPPRNVAIVYGTNGNFNENIIKQYFLNKVVMRYMVENDLETIDLLLDHAPCHLTDGVRETFNRLSISSNFIPRR